MEEKELITIVEQKVNTCLGTNSLYEWGKCSRKEAYSIIIDRLKEVEAILYKNKRRQDAKPDDIPTI